MSAHTPDTRDIINRGVRTELEAVALDTVRSAIELGHLPTSRWYLDYTATQRGLQLQEDVISAVPDLDVDACIELSAHITKLLLLGLVTDKEAKLVYDALERHQAIAARRIISDMRKTLKTLKDRTTNSMGSHLKLNGQTPAWGRLREKEAHDQ